MINYILWDGSAELFSLGQFTLRWHGFLLILAFILGRQILVYIYKKEGKPGKEVEIQAVYLIIAAYLGARIGHVIFYQPQLWSRPLTIIFPFEFKPSFHLTELTGFSSHGAVLGILFAFWLYSRKKAPGLHYLEVLDRISILAVWVVAPLLVGSFLNSEIEGKPTRSALGTVMIQPVTRGILDLPCCVMRIPGGKNPLEKVIAMKDKTTVKTEVGHHSIALYLFFKSGVTQQTVDEFMVGDVKIYLYNMSRTVYEPGTEPLHYAIFQEPNGDFEVRVRTTGIARYPVQVFEAASSLILFTFLLGYWHRYRATLSPGRIFGLSMTLFWALHFGYEYLMEDQVSFVKGMALNKAQILSIPLILIGIVVLVLSYRKPKPVIGLPR